MIEAVIFDMDGVLADGEKITFRTTQKVLREEGIEIGEKDYYPCMGCRTRDFYSKLKERFGLKLSLEEFQQKRRAGDYAEMEANGLKAIPNAIETVKALKAKGFKVAVASSASRKSVEFKLNRIGLAQEFSVTVAGDEVVNSKPDPQIFLKAAEGIGVAPEKCLVVEDAIQGIKAAKNAGMKNVALQSEHNRCLDLSLADEVISNLDQLQALIDKWNESL